MPNPTEISLLNYNFEGKACNELLTAMLNHSDVDYVIGMSGAIFAMGAVAAPAILCGIYKKNGVFLEKQVKFMREDFTRPRKRYYRTTNIFVSIERQIEYNRIKKKLRDAERK